VTAPAEETWNCEVAPTESRAKGPVVPMPTLPLSKKAILSVPVLSWTFKAKPVPVPALFNSSLAEGEVVPIPILKLVVSKLSRPDSMFKEVVEVLAKSRVEALAKDKVAAFIVRESPEASPKVVLPFTERALFRVEVPVEAPIDRVVAAPPKFKVVAVVFKRLKVVAEVVRSPPFTAISPAVVILPVA
jgi:hypothetical protein